MKMPAATARHSVGRTRQIYPVQVPAPGAGAGIAPQMNTVGSYTFSVNGHYAIKSGGQARVLYVLKGQAGPAPGGFFKKSSGPNVFLNTVTGKPTTAGKPHAAEFERYEPKATFRDTNLSQRYADYEGPGQCVRYACGLMQDAKNWGDRHPAVGFFNGTGTAVNLGAGYPALGTAVAAANPATTAGVREMMFLTAGPPAAIPHPGYNFHGATVVAVDGTDQITSEACVDSGRWQANFYMYDNTVAAQTFLGRFGGQIADGGGGPPPLGNVVSAAIHR